MSSALGGFVPDPLNSGFVPGPYWGHSFQTPAVALHFGSRFVCGPSLQTSCALVLYVVPPMSTIIVVFVASCSTDSSFNTGRPCLSDGCGQSLERSTIDDNGFYVTASTSLPTFGRELKTFLFRSVVSADIPTSLSPRAHPNTDTLCKVSSIFLMLRFTIII